MEQRGRGKKKKKEETTTSGKGPHKWGSGIHGDVTPTKSGVIVRRESFE
jgi:hypothetical protein